LAWRGLGGRATLIWDRARRRRARCSVCLCFCTVISRDGRRARGGATSLTLDPARLPPPPPGGAICIVFCHQKPWEWNRRPENWNKKSRRSPFAPHPRGGPAYVAPPARTFRYQLGGTNAAPHLVRHDREIRPHPTWALLTTPWHHGITAPPDHPRASCARNPRGRALALRNGHVVCTAAVFCDERGHRRRQMASRSSRKPRSDRVFCASDQTHLVVFARPAIPVVWAHAHQHGPARPVLDLDGPLAPPPGRELADGRAPGALGPGPPPPAPPRPRPPPPPPPRPPAGGGVGARRLSVGRAPAPPPAGATCFAPRDGAPRLAAVLGSSAYYLNAHRAGLSPSALLPRGPPRGPPPSAALRGESRRRVGGGGREIQSAEVPGRPAGPRHASILGWRRAGLLSERPPAEAFRAFLPARSPRLGGGRGAGVGPLVAPPVVLLLFFVFCVLFFFGFFFLRGVFLRFRGSFQVVWFCFHEPGAEEWRGGDRRSGGGGSPGGGGGVVRTQIGGGRGGGEWGAHTKPVSHST
jgi:hypothetical protein